MYLERIEIPRFKKSGELSIRPQVMYRFKCDECEKIYDKRPGNVSVSKSGLHFCSNDCKFVSHRKGNKLRDVSEHTSFENYGNIIPMRTPEVTNRLMMTFKERYGSNVTAALHVPGAKERRERTHLERYGVKHTFQVEAFRQKRIITWAHNNVGIKWISKSELRFKTALEEHFGKDDIIHQKWVNGHPIDFYIKSIDTYVQFDGVYWHGLNRPIDVIKTSISPRDKTIYNHWLNDQAQNEWFAQKSLRLVRITDIQNVLEAIVSLAL